MAWFKLVRYTIDIPMIGIDKDNPSLVLKEDVKTGKNEKVKNEKKDRLTPKELIRSLQEKKEFLRHIIDLHTIIRKFLGHVSIIQWKWYSTVGIGDAAHTGMLTGVIWSIKGTIVGMLSHTMRLKVHPEMEVTPNFQQKVSKTRFQCIIHFRIGYAIVAGMKLVLFWRGGIPKLRSKPLSTITDRTKPKTLS